MNTNNITIGRDVHLTLAIINGLRQRHERQQLWQRRLKPLSGILHAVSLIMKSKTRNI